MLEVLRTAVLSLWANKTRSILTMLGVVIGVGAVIAMVAVGNGASRQVEGVIAGMGVNMIILQPGSQNVGGVRQAGTRVRLTMSDIQAIRDECWSIKNVAPAENTSAQLVFGNSNWPSQITGTTPDFFDIRSLQVEAGRLIDEEDVRSGYKAAVIGATTARELFGGEDPVGKYMRIRSIPFEVVGVLTAKGQSAMGQDQDDTVIIPITTMQRRLSRGNRADSVGIAFIQAMDSSMMDSAMTEIRALMRQRHRLASGDGDDFNLRNMTEMMATMTQATSVMTLLLAAVASISLLVGGIGIMNIMLVSVTERTREIGIRMAIGAKRGDIWIQFLLEAMLLSLTGGCIGIATGFGASLAAARFLNWPTSVSGGAVALAAGFSCFVGVFFGLYPAWKASLLRPIDALRFE